jgi:hypothetical protein
MALIKCKECGNEVSNSASTCPKCGAKVPKKTGIGTWIVSGAVIWFLFSVFSGGGATGVSGPTAHSVTYYVEGSTSSASLTYNNEQGGTQQEKVSVPWQKTFSMRGGNFIYISAQNQESYGDITVRIVVDGKEFKRSNASGGYTIASASGSCCK